MIKRAACSSAGESGASASEKGEAEYGQDAQQVPAHENGLYSTFLKISFPKRTSFGRGRPDSERLVLFSTHIPEDIAVACRRVLVLDQGRVRFDGPTEDLKNAARGRVRTEFVADATLREFLASHRVVSRVRELDGVRVRYLVADPLTPGGRPVEPTLEEAYIGLIEPIEPIEPRDVDKPTPRPPE